MAAVTGKTVRKGATSAVKDRELMHEKDECRICAKAVTKKSSVRFVISGTFQNVQELQLKYMNL